MKKYAHLHPPLLARILAEERAKRGEKQAEKSAKTRLHQLYGAYSQPNMYKKAAALLDAREATAGESPPSAAAGGRIPDGAAALLNLHASTRERLPHYTDFYRFLFTHVPPPGSVLDLGCGFHPFSLPFLLDATSPARAAAAAPRLQTYHAIDICTRQAALVNQFFALHGLPAAAVCADLAASEFPLPAADLAFALKLLPVLEAQVPGGGFALARAVPAQHLVVTYPLKSLGGKEKGMARNYRHAFETAYAAGRLSPFTFIAEANIGAEWLCVLRR